MKSPRLALALAWAQILAVGFAAGVVAFALWTLWSQALGRLNRAAVIAEVRANPLRPIEEPVDGPPVNDEPPFLFNQDSFRKLRELRDEGFELAEITEAILDDGRPREEIRDLAVSDLEAARARIVARREAADTLTLVNAAE